jgi:hypothetical protein
MFPVVFPLLSGSSAVKALIGTSPVRAYMHGTAPQNVVPPYVTWSVVSDSPANELDGPPRIDGYSVQIDCWSSDQTQVITLAKAVRDAIEAKHYLTGVGPNQADDQTGRYRISMMFSFWTHR